MDRLKKPKDFLEKLRLTDSDYQDSGMINHIADLLERYSTEQLILHGVVDAKYNKRKIYDMKPQDFIGKKATYFEDGTQIFGENEKGELQMILDVRGWGAIQNLFKGNAQKAVDFQDELGAWFVDAINEKLERKTK
jgi:hypothetical protein